MRLLFKSIILLTLVACGSQEKPLDADTKHIIDSLIAVRTREMRAEMDTLCKHNRLTELPRLVDSIKREREAEIREALKTVPK